MRKGKLSPLELKQMVFDNLKKRRSEVILGPGIGVDCSVLNSEGYMLITTDPITADCVNPGRLAIYINSNDIAASGGEPIAVTVTILAPVTASSEDIRSIMLEAEKASEEINVEIIGGHTEFTDSVNRIILSCTMIGKADRIISSKGAIAGDSIIMTKYAGIEGTIILYEREPAEGYCEDIEWMKGNLSVIPEGKLARTMNISAMHDITEGGVFGAVTEMCQGAIINAADIPILPVTQELCRKYNINPYKLISSGSMLITTPEPESVLKTLKSANIKATVIGRVNDTEKYMVNYPDRIEEINAEADELFRADGVKL